MTKAALGVAGVASTLWLLTLVAAPGLARSAGPGRSVAAIAYLAGSRVCHQRPDRAFRLSGLPMPVCARCTGLYLGAPAGLALALWRARRLRGPMSDRSARGLLLWPALPTLASVGVEALGGGATPAWARLLLAVPLAAAAVWVCGERLAADAARDR